ncbi:ATP-binding protein [Flavobacterium psychrophilum]|nr:ATP-binding protein [Flavobacterium psychrophilum]EKT4509474.1 ATP-binding protein [Flavobacterium psychrophilum]ELV7524621.1 ATP-binding protein [Flavobacterium psychrophilum]
MESKRIRRHIDRLLLDPNNYRFIDKNDYKFVTEDQLSDARVQQRTQSFIMGKANENIIDLINSFKTNGFLDIDQIQVKSIGDSYLVLEGNRRVSTLKYLYNQFKDGFDVGVLKEEDFKSVPIVEVLGEDPVHHLITMGLHHISGKKRWSAVNQAQFISDLHYKYGKSEEDICNSLGITKHNLRRNTRTLALIEQYKKSDFGDQFETNMFSFFEEIIRNQAMKEWIGWNDFDYKAENENNIQRLFSWISLTEEIERTEDGEGHYIKSEPIVTQSRQIREISSFVKDEKALTRMEESRSISEAYSFSDAVGETRLKNALYNIKNDVQAAFLHSEHMTPSDFDEINKLKDKLDRLIPTSQALILINEKKAGKYFDSIQAHFTTLEIIRYRKLYNVSVQKLNKINIFAGGNNMGKTSILETFYLLSQLNDINSYLDLEKYRGKFLNDFHSKWMDKNFFNDIDLKGTFNNTNASLNIHVEQTEEDIEKSSYLSTIITDATVNGTNLTSSIHLFANQPPEQRYLKSQILCSAAFTSPYRYNEKLLHAAHKLAVDNKYFDKVIRFINEHLDDSIEKIDLVNDEGEIRFRVASNKLEKAIDLTKYGEGLQRVFEIALLLGYCKDGILCIDEIDSALHKSLLISFTKFIQETAREFNVQVFLSTHSKECIDAFIANGVHNEDITAYMLNEEKDKITCTYFEGKRLETLIEGFNYDIR